jgi:hypothetical protein
MRHCRFIRSTPPTAGLLTGVLFAILVVPLSAEDSDSRYDVNKSIRRIGKSFPPGLSAFALERRRSGWAQTSRDSKDSVPFGGRG